MTFPLRNFKHQIPMPNDVGGFGFRRKYDVHTGIDLYCEFIDDVFAIESGEVIDVVKFTGEHCGLPWWNNTWAVVIKGSSGYILYGELVSLKSVGNQVDEGDVIGRVIPVLKKDKGVVPSLNMLHVELYETYSEPVTWDLDKEKPSGLMDPQSLLSASKK